jgi:hypothetical protein
VPTIALLYDDELVPSVPTEPHDRAVGAVARPAHGVTWLRLPSERTIPVPRVSGPAWNQRAARAVILSSLLLRVLI